jgi:hypothetical protein
MIFRVDCNARRLQDIDARHVCTPTRRNPTVNEGRTVAQRLPQGASSLECIWM